MKMLLPNWGLGQTSSKIFVSKSPLLKIVNYAQKSEKGGKISDNYII